MNITRTNQPNELEIRYVNGHPHDLSVINYESATIKIEDVGDGERLIFNKHDGSDVAVEYSENLFVQELKSKTNAFQNINEIKKIIQTNNKNEIVFNTRRARELDRLSANQEVYIHENVGDLTFTEVQ